MYSALAKKLITTIINNYVRLVVIYVVSFKNLNDLYKELYVSDIKANLNFITGKITLEARILFSLSN